MAEEWNSLSAVSGSLYRRSAIVAYSEARRDTSEIICCCSVSSPTLTPMFFNENYNPDQGFCQAFVVKFIANNRMLLLG
jgi:hypothetical protein